MRPKLWRSRRFWWPAAAAAVLVLGVAIGRWTTLVGESGYLARDAAPGTESTEVAAVPVGEERRAAMDGPSADDRFDGALAHDRSEIFQYAAAPVLGRAEALLTEYRHALGDQRRVLTFSERATSLLSQTRLLLDSPAADEPELGRLLSDLEMVLVQIVFVADQPGDDERAWIEDGLESRSILPRLRNSIPAGSPVAGL